MKLLVGLGNPGREYQDTRHNVGFMLLDLLSGPMGAEMVKEKFQGCYGQGEWHGERVLLFKPQTYMNLSGQAVAAVRRFFKVDPGDVVVIYDDLDLPFGTVKVRQAGGSGGHNGIKSIIGQLGSEAFPRVKVGIGKPPAGREGASWVLSRFSSEEQDAVRGDILDQVMLRLDQLLQQRKAGGAKVRDSLREYEFTVISNAQMSEEDTRRMLERYETILLADGGEVIKRTEWGSKKLAFPVKKHFRGRYVHYDAMIRPQHLAETERLMRIDDNILRYMSVRIGENVDVNERKVALAKAEAAAAQRTAKG